MLKKQQRPIIIFVTMHSSINRSTMYNSQVNQVAPAPIPPTTTYYVPTTSQYSYAPPPTTTTSEASNIPAPQTFMRQVHSLQPALQVRTQWSATSNPYQDGEYALIPHSLIRYMPASVLKGQVVSVVQWDGLIAQHNELREEALRLRELEAFTTAYIETVSPIVNQRTPVVPQTSTKSQKLKKFFKKEKNP